MANETTVAKMAETAEGIACAVRGMRIAQKSALEWEGAELADVLVAIAMQAETLANIMAMQSGRGLECEWEAVRTMLRDYPSRPGRMVVGVE